MKENQYKKLNSQSFNKGIIFVFMLLAVFLAGLHIGKLDQAAGSVSLRDTVSAGEFSEYSKVWQTLEERHVDADPDITSRVEQSIAGLVSSYADPYTVFFPPKEAGEFVQEIQGEFSGVGIEVDILNGYFTVISPLKGSPAFKAGLQPGDIIDQVDSVDITGMRLDEIISLIRGPVGQGVDLRVLRSGLDPLNITVIRQVIALPVIETQVVNDDIFVIHFTSFSEGSEIYFKEALDEYKAGGYSLLVIDMRGNPGGLLTAALDISSYFLPEGAVIVQEIQEGKDKITTHRSNSDKKPFETLPEIIMLVDGGSASASEIVAGALSDHKVATVVGTTTFGKGSVQELIPIGKASALKVTVAKWLTPSGRSISKEGIAPQINVDILSADFEIESRIEYKGILDPVLSWVTDRHNEGFSFEIE